MKGRWLIGLLVVVIVATAVPALAADGTDLVSLLSRVVALEKRVDALESEGFARINKSGSIGTFASPDGITLNILGVTAGQYGTIVAVRITNGSTKVLDFTKYRFAIVAGEKQLADPIYREDFTDDSIQPKAFRDFVMLFDQLPAGTKSVRFVPSLRWHGDYSTEIRVSVDGNV